MFCGDGGGGGHFFGLDDHPKIEDIEKVYPLIIYVSCNNEFDN